MAKCYDRSFCRSLTAVSVLKLFMHSLYVVSREQAAGITGVYHHMSCLYTWSQLKATLRLRINTLCVSEISQVLKEQAISVAEF